MTTPRFVPSLTHRRHASRAARRGRLLCVVAGVLVAAAPALVNAAPAAAATRGFDVCNYSSHTMTLYATGGTGAFDGPGAYAPPAGAALAPTDCHHFEVGYRFAQDTKGQATYAIDGKGLFLQFWVTATGSVDVGCADAQLRGLVVVSPCNPDFGYGYRTEITDPPGTVIDIPAGQGQRQAGVLKQLCGASGVQCQFTPTSETKVDSPAHQVGNALINNTDEVQRTRVKTEDTVSETNSVEVKVEVEAGIGEIVKASISAKYGHEWETEHTFEQEVEVECPAHHKCWITATAPMLRDRGDFKLVLRDTTWFLRDVTFDSPDPNGNGAYSVESSKLTARERATLPPRFSAPKRLRETYVLPASARRAPIAQPRLRLAIMGGTTPGPAFRHRIVVARSHPRNRVVHRVRNVRVVGKVTSPYASRWRHTKRWTMKRVRPSRGGGSLRMRSQAPSQTRGRLCITVRATARYARGARSRKCYSGE